MNYRLYDLLVRHQIYIEGVKHFQINKFRKLLPDFVKDLRYEFSKVKYDSLDQLTKRELNEFQRDLKNVSGKFFDFWYQQLVIDLKDFTKSDLKLTKEIYSSYLIETGEEKEVEKVNDVSEEKVEKESDNSIVPAFGFGLDTLLLSLGVGSLSRLKQTINKGYANSDPTKDILKAIIGTPENGFKDGDFAYFERSASVITKTAMQHKDAVLQAIIGSETSDRYQWISVIDGRTSNICMSRNRKIYFYGKGPLPPAHANCRSKTVPYNGNDEVSKDESYFEWLNRQPELVQKDILGAKKFKLLKEGALTAKDFPSFLEITPLSLDGLESKLDIILTR